MGWQNGRVRISTISLLLFVCAAAPAQSPSMEATSGSVNDENVVLKAGLPRSFANLKGTEPDYIGAVDTSDSLNPSFCGSTKLESISESHRFFNPSGAFDKDQREGSFATFFPSLSNLKVQPGFPAPSANAGTKARESSSKKSLWANSNLTYWALQGLMFASVVATVETTHNCMDAGSCTGVPDPLKSRTAMYSLGVPVAVGLSILGYELKKHGNRFWYLPSVLVIGGDTVLTVHSVRASQ